MSRRNVVRVGEPLRRQAAIHRGLAGQLAVASLLAVVPGVGLGLLLGSGALASLPLWQTLGVSAALVTLALLPILVLAHRLYARLAELARAVRRLGRGEFEVMMQLHYRDELDDLAGEFNLAAKRLSDRELEHEREIIKLERDIARLSADLRSNRSDYESLEQRTSRATLLREFGERVRDARDAHDVARRLNDALRIFEGIDEAYVLSVDDERRELRYLGVVNREKGINAVGRAVAHAVLPEVSEEEWLARRAAARGRALRGTATVEGEGGLTVIHEVAIPANAGGRTQAVLWVRSRGRPLPDDDEKDIAFMVRAAGDALESVRLFQEAAQVEALRELDRMKSELIATVSHELRTPLVSIKGFAETLRNDGDVDVVTRREFLDDIIDESNHLEELINNLLDMSRIEAGMLRIQPQPIKLANLASRVVGKLRQRAAKEGHMLQLNVAPDLPLVHADAGRLEQVLRNLIENALKYSPEGGRIVLYATRDGDMVKVSVRDHGIGIAPEHAERIFDRFYRVDNSMTRGTSGTGIGLSICRGLIEAHGGRIWVESVPGKGSTFHFTVPVAAAIAREDDEVGRAAD